jgi:hypothetical protein
MNDIALASAWYPRGELSRFRKMYSQISQAYSRMVITLPPEIDSDLVQSLKGVGDAIEIVLTAEWSWGRYLSVQKALETHPRHIHYVDFDRLLRWVETCPEEWLRVVNSILHSDCLILGRSEAAYRTHPQALMRTEAISNLVISELIGKRIDVSAGSKGFSYKAAEFLLAHSKPGRALGTDGEWPVLLKKGGFSIDYLEVNGLDWEIADNFQQSAAGPNRQRRLAQEYDQDYQHWARRVDIALEIVQSGLEAARREILNQG